NVAGPSRAKFWSDDEDDNIPENDIPENPKADDRSKKTRDNMMHDEASDTNTVVNSQSENFDDAPTKENTGAYNNKINLEDDA
ncbi:hypothetical protein L195_g062746, partial [Trifolium pratense]